MNVETITPEILSQLMECGAEIVSVTEDPRWIASMKVPGFTYESYDRNGHPTIQSIMVMISVSGAYLLNVPYDEYGSVFLEWPSLVKGKMLFTGATELFLARELYSKNVKKHVKYDSQIMLGHISNSFVTFKTRVCLPNTATPIFEQIHNMVAVDKTTRKASPVPEWFKEKNHGKGVLKKALNIKPLERPDVTHIHKFKVAWSSTDNNNHANFTIYTSFAVDGLHAALKEKGGNTINGHVTTSPALQGITKDIIKNGLKNVKILFLNECVEGEDMEAHIWQDAGQPFVVNCIIEGTMGEVSNLVLEYYDNEN